jgi:predicted PurR-regulated permease PerM
MDDLIGPVTGRTTVIRSERTSEARALETLVTIAVTMLVVTALALGRQIFVPLAIAVLLSFVMAPLVKILRGFNLSRGLSIGVVVIIVGIFVTGFGLIVARQISDLSTDLPAYQQTIVRKIENLRGAASQSTIIERASEAIDTLGKALSRRPQQTHAPADPHPETSGETPQAPPPTPIPVEVQQASDPFEMMKTVAQTVLEPLVTTGIVVVFVVFILMQREDVRDRLIRLAGAQDLHRTTLAIDDAARRLSRFFLVQTSLNIAFGMIVGVGLFLIGVPSALLWGSLAAVLRFVPYVGAILSAAFPIALAAAVDPGWSMVWMTGVLFLVIETVIGQFIEPLL